MYRFPAKRKILFLPLKKKPAANNLLLTVTKGILR
jgi:hypothetical protein